MAKTLAVMKTCGSDEYEHMMRDYCWNCAPYWWNVPTCPVDGRKLNQSGFCKACRKFYLIPS